MMHVGFFVVHIQLDMLLIYGVISLVNINHRGRNVIRLKEGVGWVLEHVRSCSQMMPLGFFVVHISI